MWVYDSPVGIMRIYQNSAGRYSLQIGDTVYGEYATADFAAGDVYSFVTGCYEWDSLEISGSVEPPSDLSEWERR